MQSPVNRRSILRLVVATSAGLIMQWTMHSACGEPKAKLLSAPIARRAVKSTSISGIGYHTHLQILEIAFRSGAVYRYVDVPPAVFEALLRAESKGRYFTQHIRGRFAFHRLQDVTP